MRLNEFINNDVFGTPTLTMQEVADKHDVCVDMIRKQLLIGLQVEKEHTKDLKIALEVALDHLAEMPDYYTRLKDMEAEAEVEEDCGKPVCKLASDMSPAKANFRAAIGKDDYEGV